MVYAALWTLIILSYDKTSFHVLHLTEIKFHTNSHRECNAKEKSQSLSDTYLIFYIYIYIYIYMCVINL